MMNVIVSRANKALVVPTVTGAVTMFPDAPHLDPQRIVVPHGLRETLMLRHLGLKVPNPIGMHYDWPGGPPFAVQQKTAIMLTENPRAYVLNHMGTGKTRTLLWAWDYLFQNKLAKKVLVVAPKSTLKFVWQREVLQVMPGHKTQVLHGTKKQRLDALSKDADIYIINHDGLRVIEDALYGRADIDTLIIDELAVYRNPSGRTKLMQKFAKRFSIVWGATGAPMPNEPTDVHSQCGIITPNTVPRFRTHARELLMRQVSPHTWLPKPDAVERAFSWMQPSCRYALEDVVELPPVISRDIEVALSAPQASLYKKLATAMVTEIKDQKITALNAAAAMNKLLQVAGGWVYTQNPDFVRVDPTPRILALADLIQSNQNKVLIAIPYKHMLNGISDIFNMKGVDLPHFVVSGDTKDREEIFAEFQNDTSPTAKKPMLVHPQCVAHGVTLTAADMIIWYLPVSSLDIYDQFNARITRIGQTHKQQVLHLCSTPIERKMYKALRDHKKLQDMFLELVESATDERTDY